MLRNKKLLEHHTNDQQRRYISLGHALGIIFFAWNPVAAQSAEPIPLPRLNGAIELDGMSNEPAWEAIAPLPMTMLLPIFGGDPTERTEIRLAYDDDYIYAAGRFYTTNPEEIRGNALMRDGGSMSDDGFILLLDTFNDNETALIFVTTPAGIREDMTMANDAQPSRGGFPGNKSWNTFWDVAVERNGEGWFAEMRIPFSSLRFQDEDGQITMGLIATRRIAYKNEVITYPSIDPKWNLGIFKPSIAQDVLLEGVRSRTPIQITPYILGGQNQTAQLNPTATGYTLNPEGTRELGIDVKYSLTSNLTLDFTLNTDFAQVEADNEQINLTRFNLFFPEKRLFFQERSSVFQFSTGGRSQVFYSRRIGLTSDGPVPILGGARLVGRIGSWDVGMLSMQTKETVFDQGENPQPTAPSENFSVVRLRRRVLNDYSYAGGILTNKLSGNGRFDRTFGIDANLRPFGDDYVTLVWALNLSHEKDSLFQKLTGDDRQSDPSRLLETSRLRFNWDRRSREGWNYRVGASRLGALYDPQMGFEQREDYTNTSGQLGYTWLPGAGSSLNRLSLNLTTSFFFRNDDLRLDTGNIWPTITFNGKSGSSGTIRFRGQAAELVRDFNLPENTVVPPGKYTFYDIWGNYRTPSTTLISARFSFNAGSFYDGRIISLGTNPNWVLSRFVALGGGYDFRKVWFAERDQEFVVHVASLRINATLNTKISSSLFLQANSSSNAVGINLRLRYNPREGTDLYLVYNEGFNTDRSRETPVLPLTNNRTVLLKYSTTFLP